MQTIQDLPLVLTVEHIATILGISKHKAYQVMEYKGFPLIRVGRSKRVYRDKFFKWLESHSNESAV